LYKITKFLAVKEGNDLSGKVSFGKNANFFDGIAEKKPSMEMAT